MNKAIVFCILCILMYVSKSNFSFMYILIYLISFHTNLLSSLFIRRMGTFVIVIIPILIGMILDQLSFLSVLSIRESTLLITAGHQSSLDFILILWLHPAYFRWDILYRVDLGISNQQNLSKMILCHTQERIS